MWHSVLAVILVPSMFQAEAPNLNPDKQGTRKQTLVQDYRVVTEWQTMRRGKSEKAVIQFCLIPAYIVSPYEPSRDLVPLKIEFEESDGVAAASFRFDTDRWMHFTFQDVAMRKAKLLEPPDSSDSEMPGSNPFRRPDGSSAADTVKLPKIGETRVRVLPPSFTVAVKLKAAKNAALGAHLLRGKITYQPILDNGVLPIREMDLALPITVVDKGMISQRNPNYLQDYGSQADTKANFDASSKRQKIGLILLAILIAPLLLLEQIACGFWGQDCSC